ncbi:MAG TPA: glucose-6-phosphate dehydrogenase [Acidimicrobiales bacterium]|nr:glucose-6-phosphate dehydrogenase [Acidimicrobiales bacterium]
MAEGLDAERRAPPCVLVVFGGSGDLTTRKLLPAVARLAQRGLLPTTFSVVGVARTEWSDEDFRAHARNADPDAGPEWASLVDGFRYVAGDYADEVTFERLREVLDDIDAARGTGGNRIFYLATVPQVFASVAAALGRHGLAQRVEDRPKAFVRLVVEKPFGHDLASARQLDRDLHRVFDESQLYRIDHYLGKETVQNVLALRFANAIFEPVWNRRYVDSVQITVAESVGVGHRSGFYESAGALRDIVQNHVMQVLALVAMEPPATLDAEGIRDEKVKLLRAVKVLAPDEVADHVVRGQYERGWVEGEEVVGYREEVGIPVSSATETYVAARLTIDNWRWAGVPFFLRTGKRLPKRVTEVALTFRAVPHLPFPTALAQGLGPNAMVVRIQPNEGITLRFGAKVPGQAFRVRTVNMDFSYGAAFVEESPEAYERLLLDAMAGDPTLFIRTDEVDQAWRIWDPVLAAAPPPLGYESGTWGPAAAGALLGEGRAWRNP